MQAHLRVQAITVQPAAEDTAPFLIVRILLHCDLCGEQEIVLAGHHIKPLVQLLTSVVGDVDPELVDDGGEGTSVFDLTDPGTNGRKH